MKVQLPDSVGGISVERNHVSYLGEESDATKPRKAVMHTTEGSFESAQTVFAQHYAPNALIGYDKTGALRIVEYAPVGVMAHALQNLSGGVETNRWAVYQIELAGFRQLDGDPKMPDGSPMDQKMRKALAALMWQVHRKGGVPLARGGNGTRSVANWTKNEGWFGHVEVPENDHTDPGALAYETLFRLARPKRWQAVKAGRVFKRGSYRQVVAWVKTNAGKVRKLGGVNLRRR